MAVSCCFTGHRTIPEDETERVRARLQATIDTLHRKMGVTTFYAGGCTGFDTLAAQAVLEYRSAHPDVELGSILKLDVWKKLCYNIETKE